MRLRVVVMAVCVATAGATGEVFDFAFPIDGFQEVPPSGSTGTGSGIASYDDVTNELSWAISWSGLTGSAVAMHFHGSALPGQNAGVQVDIGSLSGLASPSIGDRKSVV